jgi:hypothetical protein
MKKGNDSTLKFCSSPTVDGGQAESLPDDVLTVKTTFDLSTQHIHCYYLNFNLNAQ